MTVAEKIEMRRILHRLLALRDEVSVAHTRRLAAEHAESAVEKRYREHSEEAVRQLRLAGLLKMSDFSNPRINIVYDNIPYAVEIQGESIYFRPAEEI